jgi:hypothetical protein
MVLVLDLFVVWFSLVALISLALALAICISGSVILFGFILFFVEGCWEFGMNTKHNDIHVEGIKIDYSLVNIFTVSALAATLQEKLVKTINQPKNFGSKGVVGGNSFFVDDAVLSFHVAHKFLKLHC